MDIDNKIINFASLYFNIDSENINKETSLMADIGIDSMDVVDFLFAVEREFDVDEDENDPLPKTINDVIKIIEKKLNKNEN